MVTEAADDAIMEQMAEPDTPHTSYSRLNDFDRCSFKYMLKYELGIKTPSNVNMARGSAGHTTLEINAKHKMKTGEDLSVEEIQDRFDKQFEAEMTNIEELEVDPAHVKDETQKTLAKYMAEEAPLVMPKAVELEFLLPVEKDSEDQEDVPPIMGFIDVIQERIETKQSEMLDRKFPTQKPRNSQDKADISDQITVYDMALSAAGTPTDLIGYENYVPPTKTIGPRIERFYRTPSFMTPEARTARHARLRYKLRSMYTIVKQGLFRPVDDPNVCNGCEVRRMCQYSLATDDYTTGSFTLKSFRKKEALWQQITNPLRSIVTSTSSQQPMSPVAVESPLQRRRTRKPPPPLRS